MLHVHYYTYRYINWYNFEFKIIIIYLVISMFILITNDLFIRDFYEIQKIITIYEFIMCIFLSYHKMLLSNYEYLRIIVFAFLTSIGWCFVFIIDKSLNDSSDQNKSYLFRIISSVKE